MDPAEGGAEFEALLEYLRRSRGCGFTGYKRSSLVRRVTGRMQTVGIASYQAYLNYLEVHPEEFGRLFDAILINVTAFFRDPKAWEALGAEVLPRYLAEKGHEEPIRAWSAGCASGAEAFSLAILLAEALGLDQFRERVKIYATDVDEEALARARLALFTGEELERVSNDRRARYFEPVDDAYAFHRELRLSVIFGRHDLIRDAPIARVDLLSCRNTLMYFNAETQARILDRFHFALVDRGLLFLGKAETLRSRSPRFVPVNRERRIFAKVSNAGRRDRLTEVARPRGEEIANPVAAHVRIREAAFEAGPVAQLAIDSGGLLTLTNERARTLFGITPADLGRPLHELQVSHRPIDLRSGLDRACAGRQPVTLAEVDWPGDVGGTTFFDVHVMPLLDPSGSLLGASISFIDITAARLIKDELHRSGQELEAACEDLQATNEALQTTNEELETINEALQTTNEELDALNTELSRRRAELNAVNTFLESILSSLSGGVVVVDRDRMVLLWSGKAEELWGLRAGEVWGKDLLDLDIGLPVHELKEPIRACLAGERPGQELTLPATNRRGKAIRCRVICTPMTDHDEIRGVILLMEAGDHRTDEDGARPNPTGGLGEAP